MRRYNNLYNNTPSNRQELDPSEYGYEVVGSKNKYKVVRKAYVLTDENILLVIYANPTNNQCIAAQFKLDRDSETFMELNISHLIFLLTYDGNKHILVPLVEFDEINLKRGLLYVTRDIITEALASNLTVASESSNVKLKTKIKKGKQDETD